MKITYFDKDSVFNSREREFKNLNEAIAHFLKPSAWSYEGKKQELEERLNKQETLLINLVCLLSDKISKEELKQLLDNKYEIEDCGHD